MYTHPNRRRYLIPGLLLTALPALAGCFGTSTSLQLESIAEQAVVRPDFQVRAYIPRDKNTADVYLSDIPGERLLDPSDSLAGTTGSIIHIHVFLIPSAGSTPIDPTACNATVRQLVLAGPRGSEGTLPAIGIYGGGGFILPDSSPGGRSFSGDLFDATLKLTHSTPGFADRLGASRMSGDFAARRDDELARGIAARFDALLGAAEARP